ncbi:MAG: Ig-like domain-containing protein [Cytophagaceae bacterium]|jgi:hypothetical protein|nr:Ig-like domain-containing protein [Cytophagaceae bacterium]
MRRLLFKQFAAVIMIMAVALASCKKEKDPIKEPVKVTEITLNKTSLTLYEDASETLTFTVAPDNASNKTIIWTTSDETIATVDQNGKVTALKAGKATITATTNDASGINAQCITTVTEPELTADFDVAYVKELENNIYPSFIYAMSEMEVQQGESFKYFTITVNPSRETDLRIVIEATALNTETVITQKTVKGKTEIVPAIRWKYGDFKNLSQGGVVDMTFVCYAGTDELARKSMKLSYKSINECILYMIENGKVINLTPLMAVYINENSPVIDPFLKEILDAGLIDSFTGYQSDAIGVINQVEAIFTRLRQKDIKYSSIATGSSTRTDYLLSQHIRFADEVLNNTQANCADGTAFFCSVLQKIGIKSYMIFAPRHVYLGFDLDSNGDDFLLLETTLIGEKDFDFWDAMDFQEDNFSDNLTKYNNDDYTDGYFFIDISAARKLIKPIGR